MASKQQPVEQPAVRPSITSVEPGAAIVGGEFYIRGQNLTADGRAIVRLGNERAHLVVSGDTYIIARVPESALVGELVVGNGKSESQVFETHIGIQIADSLHPVANPVIDREGNVFTTFSGSRGQKSPVSIYKIDANYNSKPFVTDLMNPTGLAFNRDGLLYVSSRYD